MSQVMHFAPARGLQELHAGAAAAAAGLGDGAEDAAIMLRLGRGPLKPCRVRAHRWIAFPSRYGIGLSQVHLGCWDVLLVLHWWLKFNGRRIRWHSLDSGRVRVCNHAAQVAPPQDQDVGNFSHAWCCKRAGRWTAARISPVFPNVPNVTGSAERGRGRPATRR